VVVEKKNFPSPKEDSVTDLGFPIPQRGLGYWPRTKLFPGENSATDLGHFLFFSTPYTISVALPVYTLNFAALAYTLHPSCGYFPGPCDIDCYAFVQVMIGMTFFLLLLKF